MEKKFQIFRGLIKTSCTQGGLDKGEQLQVGADRP